jgi:hypothetical protein
VDAADAPNSPWSDWDGDGRLDLLVNSQNAVWYRNVADHEGKVVLKQIGNVTERDVSGHNTCPDRGRFRQRRRSPSSSSEPKTGASTTCRKADGIVYPDKDLKAREPAKIGKSPASPAS